MDLKFAEYIVALDEERSVTRAAEKMNISQSALSNFLIRHEKEKGMKIFIRYKNTLIPTEKGQRYINALRQMCTLKAYAYPVSYTHLEKCIRDPQPGVHQSDPGIGRQRDHRAGLHGSFAWAQRGYGGYFHSVTPAGPVLRLKSCLLYTSRCV